jgi:hypothetical protein
MLSRNSAMLAVPERAISMRNVRRVIVLKHHIPDAESLRVSENIFREFGLDLSAIGTTETGVFTH